MLRPDFFISSLLRAPSRLRGEKWCVVIEWRLEGPERAIGNDGIARENDNDQRARCYTYGRILDFRKSRRL
jgi:hypothetical protein